MKGITRIVFLIFLPLCAIAQLNQVVSIDLPNDVKTKYILQTAEQKIWLATTDGLYSANNEAVEKFEETALATETITCLFEDLAKNIWIGCESGNIYVVYLSRKLSKWEPKEGLPKKPITGIAQDKQKHIWFSTYGEGLYVYDHTFLYNFDQKDGLNDNAIYDFEIDADDNVWTATDQGINICSYHNKVKRVTSIGRQQGLSDEIVKCLKINRSKTEIYVGYHEAGVDQIDVKTKIITPVVRSPTLVDVNGIEVDSDGLIISTVNGGLFTLGLKYPSMLSKALSSSRIHKIFVDGQSNTWIATQDRGLVRSNLKIKKFDFGSPKIIQAVFDEFVGTNLGLYQMNRNDAEPSLISNPGLNVVVLKRDQTSRLWVGTFGQGLYFYNSRQSLQKVQLPDAQILTIEKYAKGLLVATLSGIFYVEVDGNRVTVTDFNEQIHLPKYYVYKLFVDSKGVLWIGTGGKGLIQYDGISWKSIHHIDNQEVKTVFSICEDTQHKVWFGIDKVGLANFSAGKFSWTEVAGLRAKNITDLIAGAAGNLLIVHALGIDLFQPGRKIVTYFEPYLNNYKVDQNINSGCFHNQQYYVPSFSSLYVITEHEISKPVLSMDYLEVNGQHIEETDGIFEHNQNNIHFNISTFFLDQSLKPSFEYLVEGYDSKLRVSHLQDLEYQNLASGHYVFRIRAVYGARYSDWMRFPFQIKYPFWRRWWFIGLVSIVGSMLFYYWLKGRDARQSRELKLQRENIENQLLTLKSQINPHFLFNSFNTLIAVIETDPKIAVEFVSKLSDFYRKVMVYREKSMIPIQEELALIADFSYLIEKRFGNNIRISSDIEFLTGFVVPFSIQMLVENAVKHNIASREQPLVIRVFSDSNYYIVQNNFQPKKIKDASTHFGLEFIKKHYQYLDRTAVEIEQTTHFFTVKLPILKNENINH